MGEWLASTGRESAGGELKLEAIPGRCCDPAILTATPALLLLGMEGVARVAQHGMEQASIEGGILFAPSRFPCLPLVHGFRHACATEADANVLVRHVE